MKPRVEPFKLCFNYHQIGLPKKGIWKCSNALLGHLFPGYQLMKKIGKDTIELVIICLASHLQNLSRWIRNHGKSTSYTDETIFKAG